MKNISNFLLQFLIMLVIIPFAVCSEESYHDEVLQERERLSNLQSKIRPGMAKAEVLKIAGKPRLIQTYSNGEESLLYFSDITAYDTGKKIIGFEVLLVHGKVFSVEDSVSYRH